MKKRILIVIITLLLVIWGLFSFRHSQSQKYFSVDGQYSFYSKRSIFGNSFMSMPGDGNTGGGTIYVYDEIAKKVIFQFESSWVKSDIEASEFNSHGGGSFNCKSGQWFNLPRSLKRFSNFNDINMNSDFKIQLKTNLKDAQQVMYFYPSYQEGKFVYLIEIPEKKLTIRTLITLQEKETNILCITLHKILNYEVIGNTVEYWQPPNKNHINFAENLSQNEIENLFIKQVYKQLNSK